jgi:hypothetical protein
VSLGEVVVACENVPDLEVCLTHFLLGIVAAYIILWRWGFKCFDLSDIRRER